MKKILFSIIVILFAISCKKSSPENEVARDFVKGDIIVGIDSNVQLAQLFNYVNAYKLTIDEIAGYDFTTTIPKDSITYIVEVLNSKSYIYTRRFSASVWPHYQTNIVHNATFLWDMTAANQQDYLQTLKSLRMTDEFSTTKDMLIKVPVGKEMYWRDKFKTLPWVRWSDLNWIGGFVPYGR